MVKRAKGYHEAQTKIEEFYKIVVKTRKLRFSWFVLLEHLIVTGFIFYVARETKSIPIYIVFGVTMFMWSIEITGLTLALVFNKKMISKKLIEHGGLKLFVYLALGLIITLIVTRFFIELVGQLQPR